ncbi:MAG: hypothetical protein AABY07_02360 [Nanoarchaeota archaeon]
MGFDLENNNGFWKIHGVSYRDNIQPVDLKKRLLRPMTQDECVEYSSKRLKDNRFIVADMPLHHSIFTTLFRNSSGEHRGNIEKIRKFLDDSMRRGITNSTRIEYYQEMDIVVHNYAMPDQCVISEDIVGPDEFVKDSTNQAVYKALLGAEDRKEINAVYKWISGSNPLLMRINEKQKLKGYKTKFKGDKRVARFVVNSGTACFICYGDPQRLDYRLGVRYSVNVGGTAQESYTPQQISTVLKKIEFSELENILISELGKTSK